MTAEQIAEALWSHVPVTNWVRWCKAVQIALGADEVVPRAVADELAEALREALIDVGAKGVDDPFTMRGARVGREALAKYEEAISYGRTASGELITEELVEKLAAKAEAGFEVEEREEESP